jgi:hypothetical protein
MLTVAGIEYMVSDVPNVKLGAKDRASAAILGLLILAGSVLILQTINPNIVKFSNLLNPVAEPLPSFIGMSTSPEEAVAKLDDAQKKAAVEYYANTTGWLPGALYAISDSIVGTPDGEMLEKFTEQCETKGYSFGWEGGGWKSVVTGVLTATQLVPTSGKVVKMPGDALGLSGKNVLTCVRYAP